MVAPSREYSAYQISFRGPRNGDRARANRRYAPIEPRSPNSKNSRPCTSLTERGYCASLRSRPPQLAASSSRSKVRPAQPYKSSRECSAARRAALAGVSNVAPCLGRSLSGHLGRRAPAGLSISGKTDFVVAVSTGNVQGVPSSGCGDREAGRALAWRGGFHAQ